MNKRRQDHLVYRKAVRQLLRILGRITVALGKSKSIFYVVVNVRIESLYFFPNGSLLNSSKILHITKLAYPRRALATTMLDRI